MQDKNIIKSAFFQFFRPIFSKNLRKQLIAYGVDKYVKKLTTPQFLQALIYAQLNNHQSLRDPWAVFRKTKSGVKIHLSLKFLKGTTVPEEAIITPAKQSDLVVRLGTRIKTMKHNLRLIE